MNRSFPPKINLSSLRKGILRLLVILLIFSAGYWAGNSNLRITKENSFKVTRDVPGNRDPAQFSLFWRVWDSLEADYFDKTKLDASDMIYGAIQGMVAALGDPYTVFLPPNENKVVQEDLYGSFDGVGIQIGFRGTRLAVIAPLPGTPADEAGIKAGDYIVGIKDEAKEIDRGTVGITLPEAVEIIRGPKGSIVTLTILREGEEEPLVFDIKRNTIDVPSVILNFENDGKVAHIKLLKFSAETKDEWDKAIVEVVKKKEVEGIVLDLRNNPGGFLQSAVDIASEFLPNGSVVVTEENASGVTNDFKVERFGRFMDIPLTVIINKGSASASEILAGALRDGRKTILIGEVSFGKGTIQEPRQINGGSSLHITTARWLTPSGFWVNEEGLTPDIEVEDDPETAADEQLEKAIESL